MDEIRKVWVAVIIGAVLIGILLRFMMAEFDYNGLSYLAVVLGFGAVAIFQMVTVIVTEKMRGMSQPIRYWQNHG